MSAAARMACPDSPTRGIAAWRAAGLALLLGLTAPAAIGAKEARLSLVASDHGTSSRLTIALPKTIAPRIEASADTLVLRVAKGSAFDLSALAGRTPRRLSAIAVQPDGLRIVAAPGMQLHYQRLGEHLLVDIAATTPGAVAPAPDVTAALLPDPRTPRHAAAGPRLAALGEHAATATDAAPPPAAAALAQADAAPPVRTLPPMPAAARSDFSTAPARPGPYGGADGQGRPGLSAQLQAASGGLPGIVQPPVSPLAQPAMARPPVSIQIEAGSGRLMQLPAPAATIMAADPRVVRVQPASPTSLFLMGVTAGRTNIIATGDDGAPVIEYDVTILPGRGTTARLPASNAAAPNLTAMNAANIESLIRRLVRGGEGVRVANLTDRGLVLSGLVPSAAESQRAEAIAKAYAGENRPVINSLGLLSSIQVNLRVRVAEVSRTVTRDLGFNWAVLANDGAGFLLGLRTGSVGTSLVSAITGATTAGSSDPGRYALRYSSSRFDINGVVDALAGDNLISILAEPNLTAQSGEVASFLAGGEFPVPVNASPVTGAIGIEFKQFGVSLAFVPTVLSPERLNIRVRPEVSELTDNGSISVPLANGTVRIPALSVRRAETTIELGTGQSFAIAGLLQRNISQAASNLIGLGDIPIIGALFRSDRFKRAETELVIIVTPYLVRPVSDGQRLAAPTDGFRPATDLERILYRRQIARGAGGSQPRVPANSGFILE